MKELKKSELIKEKEQLMEMLRVNDGCGAQETKLKQDILVLKVSLHTIQKSQQNE